MSTPCTSQGLCWWYRKLCPIFRQSGFCRILNIGQRLSRAHGYAIESDGPMTSQTCGSKRAHDGSGSSSWGDFGSDIVRLSSTDEAGKSTEQHERDTSYKLTPIFFSTPDQSHARAMQERHIENSAFSRELQACKHDFGALRTKMGANRHCNEVLATHPLMGIEMLGKPACMLRKLVQPRFFGALVRVRRVFQLVLQQARLRRPLRRRNQNRDAQVHANCMG